MVKTQKEPKNKPEIKYPLKSRINNYGFIFLLKEWLADLGWAKGMAVIIEKKPDGGITIQRAAQTKASGWTAKNSYSANSTMEN